MKRANAICRQPGERSACDWGGDASGFRRHDHAGGKRRNDRPRRPGAFDHVGRDYDAIERGYFKEVGIKVETEDLDTTANSIALLSQNRFDLIEGGISAGYFNGLEKELPITMVMSRVSTPIGHNLMLRPDLKGQITDVKQLKGKVIGTNGTGSVSTYEIGKLLELGGLTINDVDLKVLPFPQYAIAFANKAIDAAPRHSTVDAAVHRRQDRGAVPRRRTSSSSRRR